MFYSRKAQAATELAILGSIVIIAFAFLINYSEKLNREQAYIQQTFRAALKEAEVANNFASYTKVVHRRMPNVGSPMELGQLQSFSNTSSVLWADGTNKEEHGVTKYQINEAEPIDIPYHDPPEEGTVETITDTYTNDVDANTTFQRTEAYGNIITTKTLSATDTLQADVTINGDKYTFTQALGADGKYYPAGTGLERSRNMQ